MTCCVMEGGAVLYNYYVYVCLVSSLRGGELVTGTVRVGECGAGDGPVWWLYRCGGGSGGGGV
jgi:hypothetical protein